MMPFLLLSLMLVSRVQDPHPVTPTKGAVLERGPWGVKFTCGEKKGVCMLDTGCQVSYFRPEILKGLPKPANGTDGDAVGTLSIPTASWSKVSLYSADKRVLKTMELEHFDGALGVDLLSSLSIVWSNRGMRLLDLKIQMNKKLNELIAMGNDTRKVGAVEVVPLDLIDRTVYVPARVNGTSGYFAIDTGSSFCLLCPNFGAKALIRMGKSEKISLFDDEVMAKPVQDALSIQLGRTLSFQSNGDVLLKVPSEEDDLLRGADGLIGCNLSAAADITALDLKDGVFLGQVTSPTEFVAKDHLPKFPFLPDCAGPFIISVAKQDGYLRVLCSVTNDVIEVPADSLIPSFVSVHKAVQDAKETPTALQARALAPHQVSLEGWIRIEEPGALPICYSPGGKVYVPDGKEVTGVSNWLRETGPAKGSIYSQKPTSPSEVSKQDQPRAIMIASLPGHFPVQIESDAPVEFPMGWSFSCPTDWTISSSDKGVVLVTSPGVDSKAKAATPPNWWPPRGYHWLYLKTQWTAVPD